MRRSSWSVATTLLTALALLGAACGGDDGGGGGGGDGQAADCSWTIGTVGALSGDFASIGQPIEQGVLLGVDDLNAQGDLACEVQVQSEDSQGSGEQIAPLAQKLVENEELVAVVGPYFSTETLAAGDIFNDAGVPFVTPSATAETIDDQGWDTFFRTVPNDGDQGPTAAAYIEEALQAKSVAVIHDNSDYGKGLGDTVAQQLGDVAEGPFVINPEEQDYSAVVAQVADVNPDVVYFGGYSPQAGPLAKQLQDGGVNAQFFSDDGTNASDFGELAGSAAQGVQVTTPAADPLKVPAAQDFVEGIQQEFNRTPGTFAAEAYDSVSLIGEALKDFNADSSIEEIRQGVIEYFDGVQNFEGITKDYTFNARGEVEVDPLEDIWIYEWRGNAFKSLGPASDFVK